MLYSHPLGKAELKDVQKGSRRSLQTAQTARLRGSIGNVHTSCASVTPHRTQRLTNKVMGEDEVLKICHEVKQLLK